MRTVANLFLVLLILFLSVIAFGYYRTFKKPIPIKSDSVTTLFVSDSVKVFWDDFGVPHIKAKKVEDLYFAVGYVHAQYRLWQMTLVQLAAEGRFAEFFGKELVSLDRYQRTIGFWRMAKKIESTLPIEQKRILEAYSNGVNSWITEKKDNLPIEFVLADMKPINWTPTHTLALIRLLAWDLNVSWWPELAYAKLATQLDRSKFEALIPSWPNSKFHSISFEEWKQTGTLLGHVLDAEQNRRHIIGSQGSHIGSNAWVVDGSKTTTGFPLLAGDPHLGFSIPGKWFEMHLELNGKNASGAMHPGAPLFVLGQNDFFAWSFTNLMADDTDFYVEQLHPTDRGQYVTAKIGDSLIFADFTYDRTFIKTREGEELVSEVKMTQNGVIVSPFIDSLSITDNLTVSMRWTGHELSNEFGMMLNLNWAESFDEVKGLVPEFTVPGQNMMYADRNGNIAMFTMARLPLRKHNPVMMGQGWNPEHHWKGWIPEKELPKLINPKRGWIANANNALVSGDYPYYLATFYEAESRYQQIEKVLSEKKVVKEADFSALQENVYSHHAKAITEIILPVLANHLDDKDIKLAHTYLSNWLFKYEISSTAATIFDYFFITFTKKTLLDEISPTLFEQLTWIENVPIRVMHKLIQDNHPLFDDVRTDKTEHRDDIILSSMKETIAFLREYLGDETYNWRWESLHTLTLEPLLFSQAAKQADAPKMLKMIVSNVLNRGPYGVPGNGTTVNNGQYSWKEPFSMVLGPSIRRIVDLSDLRSSKSVLPGGQSGIALTKDYNNQTELWLTGKYKTLIQHFNELNTEEMELLLFIPKSDD